MALKYCIKEMMYLGAKIPVKDNGQCITRYETGKKQFRREGLRVLNHRIQKIPHILVLTDHWMPVELRRAPVYCSRIVEFVYRSK